MGWGKPKDDGPKKPFDCTHKGTNITQEQVDRDGKPWKINHWCECGIVVRTTDA